MKKTLVILLIILNLTVIIAQSEKRLNIYFPKNQFTLSENSKTIIDEYNKNKHYKKIFKS